MILVWRRGSLALLLAAWSTRGQGEGEIQLMDVPVPSGILAIGSVSILCTNSQSSLTCFGLFGTL